MAKLAVHQSAVTTKMLFIGDSGAGKTGALASLAGAGYNLRVLDLDAGLDVLANLLRDPKSPYGPDALARVDYETITDKMKVSGKRLIPGKATVWERTIGMLENWKSPDGSETLGGITSWTPQDVLVIDSLTLLSTAALNFVLAMNSRLGQQPHQSDWYQGQQLIEGLLQTLYDDNVKCNVIIISHIAYIGEENGPVHGYPNTLGKALPPKVGRYFNSILMARTQGSGSAQKRKIFANSVGTVELKNTSPLKVKSEYPLESGLADYFRDVRSGVDANS